MNLPSPRAGQGQRPGPFGDRASLERPSSPRTSETSQQRAGELLQLRDALQSLPPSVAEAISRHVSCTNEALQRAESERRAMARSLSAAHSQLALLPQLQVSTEQHVFANVRCPLPLLAVWQHSNRCTFCGGLPHLVPEAVL